VVLTWGSSPTVVAYGLRLENLIGVKDLMAKSKSYIRKQTPLHLSDDETKEKYERLPVIFSQGNVDLLHKHVHLQTETGTLPVENPQIH
jgi:hypothetical protein